VNQTKGPNKAKMTTPVNAALLPPYSRTTRAPASVKPMRAVLAPLVTSRTMEANRIGAHNSRRFPRNNPVNAIIADMAAILPTPVDLMASPVIDIHGLLRLHLNQAEGSRITEPRSRYSRAAAKSPAASKMMLSQVRLMSRGR
jgi:hypothetical protein